MVSIGETLARARREAGLSVADISNRTRIRQAIIERIERDDYSARGIDLFTRGEIREIAQVVGVDSKQLIEEYDATRLPAVPRPRAAEQPPAGPTLPARPGTPRRLGRGAASLRRCSCQPPSRRSGQAAQLRVTALS